MEELLLLLLRCRLALVLLLLSVVLLLFKIALAIDPGCQEERFFFLSSAYLYKKEERVEQAWKTYQWEFENRYIGDYHKSIFVYRSESCKGFLDMFNPLGNRMRFRFCTWHDCIGFFVDSVPIHKIEERRDQTMKRERDFS